jgi:hypothetical protein
MQPKINKNTHLSRREAAQSQDRQGGAGGHHPVGLSIWVSSGVVNDQACDNSVKFNAI